MTFETAVAQRLKSIIKQMNITKEELAERSGFAITIINNILNEKTKRISPKTLSHIIKALKMSYTEFFSDKIFDWKNLSE